MVAKEDAPDTVGAVPDRMAKASDTMVIAARDLVRDAGGVDRNVPTLPDDRLGLMMLLVQFDEAREHFERRTGERTEALGATLAVQAIETRAADVGGDPGPMPEAGR